LILRSANHIDANDTVSYKLSFIVDKVVSNLDLGLGLQGLRNLVPILAILIQQAHKVKLFLSGPVG